MLLVQLGPVGAERPVVRIDDDHDVDAAGRAATPVIVDGGCVAGRGGPR